MREKMAYELQGIPDQSNPTTMREKGAPAWGTWPSANNAEGWRLREQHRMSANVELVVRVKRRERWQILRAELGQEYLAKIKD